MSWNYRVLKSKDGDDDWFQLHEIYYDKENTVNGWVKAGATVHGNSIDDLRDTLNKMLEALDKEELTKITNQNNGDERDEKDTHTK